MRSSRYTLHVDTSDEHANSPDTRGLLTYTYYTSAHVYMAQAHTSVLKVAYTHTQGCRNRRMFLGGWQAEKAWREVWRNVCLEIGNSSKVCHYRAHSVQRCLDCATARYAGTLAETFPPLFSFLS